MYREGGECNQDITQVSLPFGLQNLASGALRQSPFGQAVAWWVTTTAGSGASKSIRSMCVNNAVETFSAGPGFFNYLQHLQA